MNPQLFFTDYFHVSSQSLQNFGALDICLEADLPLFIDPFLLFASERPEYKQLHDRIVGHLLELKNLALSQDPPNESLFKFPEVKQNWLGVCKWGNNGRGLGSKFARDLIKAFRGFYRNFGEEDILESAHIEKLTLVGSGIGRDFISDFTANLALEYLLEYTQRFAEENLRPEQIGRFSVRCSYDKSLRIWRPRSFNLPYFYKDGDSGDFIVLTPLDILSKDESFISHSSFVAQFRSIASSLDNLSLRSSINEFFSSKLPADPRRADIEYAIDKTVERFPEIIDHYIRHQENNRGVATAISAEKVQKLRIEIIDTIGKLTSALFDGSDFYTTPTTSYSEALARAKFLKEVIEKNDGYRIFYKNGNPIAQEESIQRIFRLTWFSSPYDVNSEVNNGRGPADYKISFGQRDSTIVEFKLGSSTSLERNLINQASIYKEASKSINDISVILCYTPAEIAKVKKIMKRLKIEDAENVLVIDATPKISASKA
ncbi:hypothetical protein E2F49_10710 [Luteimonas terrae]|uniref:Uncharacterized protein n=1 Tax=Luteimonas terrae TaxID=1530191 RepID=A0A4R5U9N9_9GAMM|nr:hypothetical protein E2F49_10710 [Luteimonas terrae]